MKHTVTALALLALSSANVLADDMSRYQVTISNATTHHVFTPPLLVTHHKNFSLFNVGSPASESLATLAETGNNQPLYWEVANASGVYDTLATATFIPYGNSATFEIRARKNAKLSLAGMMATTNDGFVGLTGMDMPRDSASYYAFAYDAGSEMNNENCAYIPGPPCSGDSGNARTESGEGFVTVHNGIQGGADLNPKQLDWRGPVAIVTINKMDD